MSDKLELVVQEQTLGTLTTNIENLKAEVLAMLPRYDVANYTEDNIAEAREDRATLNKLSKALNARRIEFEKAYLEPIADFKKGVNETSEIILKAAAAIDKVIKGVEDRTKAERVALINELWAGMKFDEVPLAKVMQSKWMLKATGRRTIAAEMNEAVNNIRSNLGLLAGSVAAEEATAVRVKYLETLNFGEAIALGARLKIEREKLEAERQKVQEQRNRESAEREAEEAAAKLLPPHPAQYNYSAPAPGSYVPAPEVPRTPDPVPGFETQPDLIRVFRVTAPKWKIIQLGDFMKQNGIHFEKVGES